MACKVEKKINLAVPGLEVWKTYRDELPDIGKTMPAVESIETLSREEEGNTVYLENKWKISEVYLERLKMYFQIIYSHIKIKLYGINQK